MKSSPLYPVIMAGGNGSRLWPLSRTLYPKQFLCLDGLSSMLQTTIKRLNGIACEDPIVICNEAHRFVVAEQLEQMGKLTKNIILEPEGRNTAPAIALASLFVTKRLSSLNSVVDSGGGDDDPLLLILSADHVIRDEEIFRQTVLSAIPLAAAGNLVTFGIVPDAPEIGYGYIKRGNPYSPQTATDIAYHVAQFVEKPDADTARQYLESGEYYWNSGMFMFRASRYLEEIERCRPDILAACQAAVGLAIPDLDFLRVDRAAFMDCPDESIDYAVMEQTDEAVVVPISAGWSDVGSWSSLWEISDKDGHGNVHHGDVLNYHSVDNYVHAESGLVTTVGVENLIIVQTKDALLVASRERVQDVKKIVELLKLQGRSEHYIHREVYRPWGRYDSIDTGERYQVKRITVKPGEGLSLHMHYHRAEHWIVVGGTAKVTKGTTTQLISENESIYIPLGEQHCLENPGMIPLELIEVRTGSYISEDDIVRLKDRYGRI
ncbi:mannose-1-phosphate guanylyltransferase/mannose-6-phosphate isomerase [Brenneria uluponensis]|uniref:mannose-1-phosphate guanylyltransferase/mannose-6-phosphate isomerase n=1 Tax=Brenneria uluponensis TaxID=3057057 RepID=UPI0028EA1CDC|nr:mannose-1-phosphate guanylyltransferase/mannose-6-phosphate isomerase [Brenneria ulupoensis]